MAAAALPLIISGISALGGYLANRKSQQKTTQDHTQSLTSSSETQPNYDSQMSAVKDYLLKAMMERYESPFESTEYETGGIAGINKTSDINTRLMEALLSKYGIRGTGMGITAQMMNQMNRLNKTSEFQSQIPLLSDQWRKSNLQTLSDFFTKLPVGSKTSGTQTSTGQSTGTQFNPGNPWAGALQGGGSMLGYLYGQGAFGKNSAPNIPVTDMGYNVSTPGFVSPNEPQNWFDPRRYNLGRGF